MSGSLGGVRVTRRPWEVSAPWLLLWGEVLLLAAILVPGTL